MKPMEAEELGTPDRSQQACPDTHGLEESQCSLALQDQQLQGAGCKQGGVRVWWAKGEWVKEVSLTEEP